MHPKKGVFSKILKFKILLLSYSDRNKTTENNFKKIENKLRLKLCQAQVQLKLRDRTHITPSR